jgi:hypothetical protein
MSLNINYNALTDSDLHQELEWEGYVLRYNETDELELFTFSGGYQTTRPYQEQSTGETFDCVQAAHRYVFTP